MIQRGMRHFFTLSNGMLLSLVLVLPLMRMGWDSWAQTIVRGTWAFLLVLGGVLIGLGRSGDFSRGHRIFRQDGWVWGAFLGASLLSLLWTQFPTSAHPAFLNDFVVLAFWMLGAGMDLDRRPLYLRALAGSAVLGVAGALVQGSTATVPWAGPLLNANLLAALVLLAGPLTLQFSWEAADRRRRVGWALCGLVLVIGFLLSRSMVGYGVVVFQLALWGWMRRKGGGRWEKAALWVGAAAILIGAGVWLARADWPKLLLGDSDRWTWYGTALRAFAANPLLGVGPGAFGEAYPLYRISDWSLNSLYAHNFVLESLAERGILGGGALFLIIGLSLRRGLKGVRAGQGSGLFLGMAGFCLYNFFHIGFSFPALLWLFFLAAGLAGPVATQGPSRVSGKPPWILLAALGMFLGGASLALFRAEQCLSMGRVAWASEKWERAQDVVGEGLSWNPWNPALFELRAALRLKAQDWDGAGEDLDRAVRLAPGNAVYRLDRAEWALERGDVSAALQNYERAVRLMPLKAWAWERWGDLLARRGRLEEAQRAYAGALRALADPRVLGGDAERRAVATKRVQDKEDRFRRAAKN